MNSKLTQNVFLLGACYFILMAIAHFFSLKVPLLFVYFDTPFYAYQDKIISFAVMAYVALFYAASKHRDVALLGIGVMAITTLGLSFVNVSRELTHLLKIDQSTLPYWLQTILIGLYTLGLIVLYVRDGKNSL